MFFNDVPRSLSDHFQPKHPMSDLAEKPFSRQPRDRKRSSKVFLQPLEYHFMTTSVSGVTFSAVVLLSDSSLSPINNHRIAIIESVKKTCKP